MVIDSSALVAILMNEPEKQSFIDAIEADEVRLMSSASLLETAIVIEARWGDHGARELNLAIARFQIDVVSLDVEQVGEARRAWRRFGKGNHRAGLNFGDLCSYGLASTSEEPLLFKGDDFAATDLTPALRR